MVPTIRMSHRFSSLGENRPFQILHMAFFSRMDSISQLIPLGLSLFEPAALALCGSALGLFTFWNRPTAIEGVFSFPCVLTDRFESLLVSQEDIPAERPASSEETRLPPQTGNGYARLVALRD